MKSDVLVIGNELDGLVAALRLLRAGCSVRLLAPGLGSLHYGSGGLHVLARLGGEAAPVVRPLDVLDRLPPHHPYSLAGRPALQAALSWMVGEGAGLGLSFLSGDQNREALTLSGRGVPVLAPTRHQALAEQCDAPIAIVRFRGHREFPAALLHASLRQAQVASRLADVDPPPGAGDNAGVARAFDRLADPHAYFRSVGKVIGGERALVLFPAVLGLDCHEGTMQAAEAALGAPCREVQTLPTSVPGQRLSRRLIGGIQAAGGLVQLGNARVTAEPQANGHCRLRDEAGRRYEARVVLLATGGVLMGGLEVTPDGHVREPVFDLPVHQTRPLQQTPEATVTALHRAGVEAECDLRPRGLNGSHGNVLVTGRTLAHWDPVAEGSAEGVALATGWAAAERALEILGR